MTCSARSADFVITFFIEGALDGFFVDLFEFFPVALGVTAPGQVDRLLLQVSHHSLLGLQFAFREEHPKVATHRVHRGQPVLSLLVARGHLLVVGVVGGNLAR